MDQRFVKFVASGSLLLFGIVSILLLTISIREIKEPAHYMPKGNESSEYKHKEVICSCCEPGTTEEADSGWFVVSDSSGSFISMSVIGQQVQVNPWELWYGIVLDAGSSHTALYIYKWPADKLNGTGVVTQHSECHVKGGGISGYAGQQGSAGRSLDLCLRQAMRDVPPDRHHCTPVYLGATAGMRLLQITNPDKASQVLKEVEGKIKSFPFSFRGAVILSGQEEGVYGWVTVNYLLENFIKYGFVGRWLKSGRRTLGALDLGGASTQITFETPERVENEKNRMSLRLYGHVYSLYTHSYLCYGKEEALRMILAHLYTSQANSHIVYNPCYPPDFSDVVEPEEVFDSPCTPSWRPKAYKPDSWIRVQGTGDYQSCLGNTSDIFSFHSCPFSQCSFNEVFQPNISGSFMAFSAYFFTHSFLQRSTGMKISSSAQLQEATKAVCNMTIKEMAKKAPDLNKYLKDYCAVAVYIQVLMLRGYKFDEHSFQNVAFQKKAGEASVGWALGYILSVSSLLPEEPAGIRKGLCPAAWISLLILITALLICTLCYMLFVIRRKRSDRDVS